MATCSARTRCACALQRLDRRAGATSHRITSPSSPVVTSERPSGVKRASLTAPRWRPDAVRTAPLGGREVAREPSSPPMATRAVVGAEREGGRPGADAASGPTPRTVCSVRGVAQVTPSSRRPRARGRRACRAARRAAGPELRRVERQAIRHVDRHRRARPASGRSRVEAPQARLARRRAPAGAPSGENSRRRGAAPPAVDPIDDCGGCAGRERDDESAVGGRSAGGAGAHVRDRRADGRPGCRRVASIGQSPGARPSAATRRARPRVEQEDVARGVADRQRAPVGAERERRHDARPRRA